MPGPVFRHCLAQVVTARDEKAAAGVRRHVADGAVAVSRIHASALVEPNVQLGEDAVVEPFAILGIQDRFHPPGSVVIGRRAFIGSRCTVYAGVVAGDDWDISDQTTVFTDNVFGDGSISVATNGAM